MVDTSQYLDRAFCNVFAVTLRDSDANHVAGPPVIYLQGLSEVTTCTPLSRTANFTSCRLCVWLILQELQSENLPLTLARDTLDRMLMARLLDPPEDYPQWPLQYLLGCYARASQEIRALTTLKDKQSADTVQLDLQYCKQLIARNAGLLLSMGLFPQVNCKQSFHTPLFDLLMHHATPLQCHDHSLRALSTLTARLCSQRQHNKKVQHNSSATSQLQMALRLAS